MRGYRDSRDKPIGIACPVGDPPPPGHPLYKRGVRWVGDGVRATGTESRMVNEKRG